MADMHAEMDRLIDEFDRRQRHLIYRREAMSRARTALDLAETAQYRAAEAIQKHIGEMIAERTRAVPAAPGGAA